MEKHLGKINKVRLGSGGYDDAMFGITFDLRFDGSCVISDFWGTWNSDPSDGAKWSLQDRINAQSTHYERLRKLMNAAKVNDIRELEGVPIEVVIVDMKLSSWRILEEVL